MTSPVEVLKQLEAMEDHIACEAETHCEQVVNGKRVRAERRWDADKRCAYGVWFVNGVETPYVDLDKALFGVSQS